MERQELEAFAAVAAHRSFTRAAESLFLTQPAVTRQIAGLEAKLHTRLFDRLGRTIELTPAGEILLRYTESILRLTEEARQAIADIEAGTTGRLTVGASSTLATYLLPDWLRAFRERAPHVEIVVHTGISAAVVQMVRENEAEVGLVTSETNDPKMRVLSLADYATCVVVPQGHALAHETEIEAERLANVPLILMETGTNLRTYVDRLLSAAGVQEQVTMEMDNVEAIKRMIEAGLGVSLLPEVAVRAEVASGRLVALRLRDVPRTNRRIALIHRSDRYLSAPLKAFMELVRQRNGVLPLEEAGNAE